MVKPYWLTLCFLVPICSQADVIISTKNQVYVQRLALINKLPKLVSINQIQEKDQNILVGVGAQNWYFSSTEEENLGHGVFQYQEQTQSLSKLPQTFSNKVTTSLVCQTFGDENAEVIGINLVEGELNIANINTGINESVAFNADELLHGICGNLDADIIPDIILLSRDKEHLRLTVIPQMKWTKPELWQIRDVDFNDGTVSLDSTKFYIIPRMKFSSIELIQLGYIAQAKTPTKVELAEPFMPYELVAPFEYQTDDFVVTWINSMGLSRAAAKVMWNFGASSPTDIVRYIESLGYKLSKEQPITLKQLSLLMLAMDPNQNQSVATELAKKFMIWKGITLIELPQSS